MNILDVVADFITKLGGWFLGWFGNNDEVKAVQEKVAQMCGFLPTAASVAAMLSASNPTVTGVIGIAGAICQVVHGAPGLSLMSLRPTGMVNGVPVEGDWIIKEK